MQILDTIHLMFAVFLNVMFLWLTSGCIYLLSASYQALTAFAVKYSLTIETYLLWKESERREREKRERGKTPDTSDSTSQPVKEESRQGAKPPLPAASCKVEILPFTFGQMQEFSCVCVCVYVHVCKAKAFDSETSSYNKCLLLLDIA